MSRKSRFNVLRGPDRRRVCLCLWAFVLHMPVYGDVFQQFVGQAVKQDDSLGGNFQSNLLGLLSTGFGLLDTQKIKLLVLWHFLSRAFMMHAS